MELPMPDAMKWEVGDWINERPKSITEDEALQFATIILKIKHTKRERDWMAQPPPGHEVRIWVDKGLAIIAKYKSQIQRMLVN